MKKKGKRIKSVNDEIPLPEAMIQHIQSYLSRKEAARTTILSKSWYKAWLTRPIIDLNRRDFGCREMFEEFAKKTLQRYQDLSLKIESFRLYSFSSDVTNHLHNLIVNAMKLGASDVQLDLSYVFTLPQEVLGSENLHKLSVRGCEVGIKYIGCSRIKSLSFKDVRIISGYALKDIISCCNSLEELSVSWCYFSATSPGNLREHHKLTRLSLERMNVDSIVRSDFASKFPCLKDLSILSCFDDHIQIASTSLQTIRFEQSSQSQKAKFHIPNIQKFTYSGFGLLTNLSIKGASREWELDISIVSYCFHRKPSWFLNLKKSLTKFRLSRVSLSLILKCGEKSDSEHEVLDVEAVPMPLVVENLMVHAPSTYRYALLLRSFGICRPKFLTVIWLTNECKSFDILRKRLMHQEITPDCGIPDQDIFGKFGLKKVSMEKDWVEKQLLRDIKFHECFEY